LQFCNRCRVNDIRCYSPRRTAEFVLGSLTTSTQLLLPCVHTAGTALLAASTDLRRPCLACAPPAPLRPFLYRT